MTNEDKLREIFPKTIFVQHKESDKITMLVCSDEWLNAEYKEPQTFKWCTDCREYDQEKHCCHRWSKAIRNTVEQMKQEYIEREVLDKIRAEVANYQKDAFYSDDIVMTKRMVLAIIDKYKVEKEEG